MFVAFRQITHCPLLSHIPSSVVCSVVTTLVIVHKLLHVMYVSKLLHVTQVNMISNHLASKHLYTHVKYNRFTKSTCYTREHNQSFLNKPPTEMYIHCTCKGKAKQWLRALKNVWRTSVLLWKCVLRICGRIKGDSKHTEREWQPKAASSVNKQLTIGRTASGTVLTPTIHSNTSNHAANRRIYACVRS